MESLRLMCAFSHPDDETLGAGGVLAKYAAEGVETYLVTATRGERGWFGPEHEYPGLEELGRIREGELQAAAGILGLREVAFLDYCDGELDQADHAEAVARLVDHLRRVRPHVVITFDPNGSYGHPDHIAICQFTTAAVVAAADGGYTASGLPPFAVSKLYYLVDTQDTMDIYEGLFGDLVMQINGVERRVVPWQEWAITTRIDTSEYWQQVWRAVACHRTQLPNYDALVKLPEEQHRKIWGERTFYRVFSLVNGGTAPETDLFEGLR